MDHSRGRLLSPKCECVDHELQGCRRRRADDSADESTFAALEQRVPLVEGTEPAVRGNVQYSGTWDVQVDKASSGMPDAGSSLVGNTGSMVVSVPANASLFALSGLRGPGYGRFEVLFSPTVAGTPLSDAASNTDTSSVTDDASPADALLYDTPLDPAVIYTVNITSAGARLRALHYWPVNE